MKPFLLDKTRDGWVAPSPNQQEDHVYLYNLYMINYIESYKCVKFGLLDNAGKCIVGLSEAWGDPILNLRMQPRGASEAIWGQFWKMF